MTTSTPRTTTFSTSHRLTVSPSGLRCCGRFGSKLAGRGLAASLPVFVFVFIFFVFGAALPGLAQTTWTVSDTSDNASDPGSLRYAVNSAQNGDTIVFNLPNPSTITLVNGGLYINTSVTINGPGPSALFISGVGMNGPPQSQDNVLYLNNANVTVSISGVTIENGFEFAGGIVNVGTLTLTNSAVSGNSGINQSGGILNFGTLVVDNSTVSGNTVYSLGAFETFSGGISNSGTAIVINSNVSGNTINTDNVKEEPQGGGIFNSGTMTVINSTVSANSGLIGGVVQGCGAIYNAATMTIIGSTVSNNNTGGAICNAQYYGNSPVLTVINTTMFGNAYGAIFPLAGKVTVSNSTIFGNQGPGIFFPNGTPLTLRGTLLADNHGEGLGDCASPVVSEGYNLDDDGTCGFNQTGDQSGVTNAASFLGTLQNNGGLTQTIALLPGSTAIDAIPANACTDASGNPVTTDQRGIARPQGAGCDIGAFEVATANVCSAGQTTPAPCSYVQTLNFYLPPGATLGSSPVQIVAQGSTSADFTLVKSGTTCTSGLAGPASCNVNLKFAPVAPGLRVGAVNLIGSSGSPVATQLISGVGQGPAIAFGPGTQTTIGSGWSNPYGLAVDEAGDVFVADIGNKRVVEIPAGGGAPITIGSGFNLPDGVAVDGAGDVFVADNGNDQVVEVPAGCTSASCQNTVGSGLGHTTGVAVDGAGDVFIADYTNHRVVEVPAGCTSSVCQTTVGSGLNSPFTAAVDGAGDVFISDNGNGDNRVVEVPAGCTSASCQITVASGLGLATGVAVDAAGDVFIADLINNRVVEVPAGCADASCQSTVASAPGPTAVTVDAAGDVFIIGNGTVLEVNRSQPPALSFANTVVGQTSSDSPQALTIQNVGNQPLNAVAPGLVVTGPNFLQVAGSGTPADCSAGFALTPGASCNLSISFEPQNPGPLTSTALFTDNALNFSPSASQSIALRGAGTGGSQVITFTVPAPATAKTGDMFTVVATGGGSGNPVTFSVGAGSVCTLSGAATYTMTSDNGSCYVVANQAGNTYYTAAPQVTETVIAVKKVTKVAPTVTFTGAPASAAYLSTFTVTTTQNSGLTPVIRSLTANVCSVSGGVVTMKKGTGTCTVKASWPSDDYYFAASLEQSTTATLLGTTTTVTNAVAETAHPLKVEVYFTVSNGMAPVTGNVTVTAAPGGETCTGSVTIGRCLLTFTAAGPETLTAVYAGNDDDSTSASNSYPLTVQ